MIRTFILFSISIIVFGFVEIVDSVYLAKKPGVINELKVKQKNANEKFITAQLLSSSLERVYKIFELNLVKEKKKKENQDFSIHFLNYLTDILNDFEIKVLSIKPKLTEKRGKNHYNPYEIDIKTSYEKFGKLIAKLEESKRLISIDEIYLNNGLERIRAANKIEQLRTQDITLVISTISLYKAR